MTSDTNERRVAVEAAKVDCSARLRRWYWPCAAIGLGGALVVDTLHGATRCAVYAAAFAAWVTLFAKLFIELRRFKRRLRDIYSEQAPVPR
jgi:hypothetical protein